MGFGKNKNSDKNGGDNRGSSQKSSGKADKVWRKVASLWESQKFDGHTVSIDDYSGELIWHDKETGAFYKVKQMSVFDPKDGAPKNLLSNFLINLNSEYDVEEMTDNNSGESQSEERNQPDEKNDRQESGFSQRKNR